MEGHFWPTMRGLAQLQKVELGVEQDNVLPEVQRILFLPGPRVLKDSMRPEATTSGQNHECVKVGEANQGTADLVQGQDRNIPSENREPDMSCRSTGSGG